MTVRVSRKDWWGRPEPGDVRVDREGRVVKALGRKYSPDQPRVPAGESTGGQWTSSGGGRTIVSAAQIKTESDLRSFADTALANHEVGSLPREVSGKPLYAHAVRWPDELDSILKDGLRPKGGTLFASSGHVRDRGSGFVLFMSDEEPQHGIDFVEPGLTYPEERFKKAIPPKNIIRVVRHVVTSPGGHSIREDRLARYALEHQGEDASNLPERYRSWFNIVEAKKYSPDQPRVPAGSPEGGQWVSREIEGGTAWHWTGPGEPVGSPFDPTAKIGGIDLARKHEQAIYRMAGNTDAYGKEYGTVVDGKGNAEEIAKGKDRSIRLRDIRIGDQGTIHTHPSQPWMHDPELKDLNPEDRFTGPSPRDVQVHINNAWNSSNENFTTVIVSLSADDPRVMVTTVRGWPKGGPRNIEQELRRFVLFHATGGISISDPVDFRRRAKAAIRDYATTVLGLEWEEEFFG